MLLKPVKMQARQSYLNTWPNAISVDCHNIEKSMDLWHFVAIEITDIYVKQKGMHVNYMLHVTGFVKINKSVITMS